MDELTNEKDLRSLLSQKFEEHHIEAPQQAWNAIQAEMFPNTSKKRGAWVWWIFGTLIGGLVCTVALTSSTENILLASASKSTLLLGNDSDQHIFIGVRTESKQVKISKAAKHQIAPSTENKSKSRNKKDSRNRITNPSNTQIEGTIDSTRLLAGTIQNTRNAQSLTDSSNRLAFSPLFPLQTSLLLHALMPFSADQLTQSKTPRKAIASGWYIEAFSGLGRNIRSYEGYIDNAKGKNHAVFVNRTVKMKNTNMGIYLRKELTSTIQVRTGINYGYNTFTTRFFPIRIANGDLNKEIDVSSPVGELKSGDLDLESEANPTSDSTTFLMRLSHRSSYFQLPLSLTFNSVNARGPQVYGFTGVDFIVRGSEENNLLIRRQDFARTAQIERLNKGKTAHIGVHAGFGLASSSSENTQVYTECLYSRILGPYYTGNVLTIYSQSWQLNVGLRFKL
jgi:hypothetical protein